MAEYLCGKGYEILERNFNCRLGEIDIIAREKESNTLVFCEVKYRSSLNYGDPLEAVTQEKIRHICRAAGYYYTYKCGGKQQPCRFDCIAVYGDGSIRHVKDAFGCR